MSEQPGLTNIKHIIAIASGKGGVGKSTVSTNLAVAPKHAGFKVGLMDGDLYGPSQPAMLGRDQQPSASQDGYILPVDKYGVKFISMGIMNPSDGAIIMRAPMAIKAIQQFLMGVVWGELDYLLIDLPPGTGDIQLTLAQQARLSGAVIVSTPQKVALEISKKGLQMFETLNVPILGIVENMSGFSCKHCGGETKIFKAGGGEALSAQLKVPFLGSIPLDPEVMMSGDDGIPLLEKDPNLHSSRAFLALADRLVANVKEFAEVSQHVEPEKIELNPQNGSLRILWKDGTAAIYEPHTLRAVCPCANCVDEATGVRTLRAEDIPLDIKVQGARPVGRYGLALTFSDGHNTGIFKFKRLRELENIDQKEGAFSV